MENTDNKKEFNNAIRTYYMRLDGDCSQEQSLALYRMLPEERRELVDRAEKEEIAKKRIYTGAFLQYVLSKETGIAVENLRYTYNECGKPELDAEGIYFNLSHSGDYAVLAVGDSPVGIDIEYKSRNYMSLAKRCFCREEYEDIAAVEEEQERRRRFLEYWTMKEAYIKYVGEGLRIPLNSFRIERGSDGISFLADDRGVVLKTYFMEDDYCVSLCVGSKYAAVKGSCVRESCQLPDIDLLLSDVGNAWKNAQEIYLKKV